MNKKFPMFLLIVFFILAISALVFVYLKGKNPSSSALPFPKVPSVPTVSDSSITPTPADPNVLKGEELISDLEKISQDLPKLSEDKRFIPLDFFFESQIPQ